MSKDANRTLAPNLRFPGFQEDTAWKWVTLGELAERITTRNHDEATDRVLTNSAEHGVLDQRDYFDKDIATAGHLEGYYVVERGDFVYNPRISITAPVGPISRNEIGKGVMSPLYTVFCFRTGCTKFYKCYFESACWHPYLRGVSSMGARHDRMSVSIRAFMGMPVPCPPPLEQQKIADCLTSLHEVIAAQSRKVEALKAHKKGLMQQLFPRGGETFPRLRFTEFRDAPEWEEKRGGELFTNRKDDGEEGLPMYSVTVNAGMVPRASFYRDFHDIEDPAGNRKACKGDIAYNMMRMWQGAQGVAVEDCMVSPAYVVLAPRAGVSADFFAHLFKLPQSLLLLTAHSRGLTKDRLRLYFDDFAQIKLRVPTRAEQQRIADCLNSLDARIGSEAERLVTLRAHKKGLMQQMFPTTVASQDLSAGSVGDDEAFCLVVDDVATTPGIVQPLVLRSRKPYSAGFARQLLAAEILQHCHREPTMGRVKLQKLIHLCEYHAELDEIHGNYAREAAGPFDNKLMRGVAIGLERQKWFKQVRGEKGSSYEPMQFGGQHSKYLERWSEKLPKIREIIQRFEKAKTLSCEIASTLYAAWNDLLIDGRQPTDEEIIREASDPKRWHESKATIEKSKWPTALKWMRARKLVPRGYGAHTTKRVAS